MCLNCGCGQYWDDLGIPDNITMQKVEKAAKANGSSVDEALKEMMRSLPEALTGEKQEKVGAFHETPLRCGQMPPLLVILTAARIAL